MSTKHTKEEYKLMILKHTNFDYGVIFPGKRFNKGNLLQWELMRPLTLNNNIYNESQGVIPTIIDWKFDNNQNNNHPGNTTPKGCELLQLKCIHPKYNEINKIFSALNIEKRFYFEIGENAEFVVTLSCPNGIITISDSI